MRAKFILKKALILFLSFAIAQPAFADPVKELESRYSHLQKTYYNDLKNRTENIIQQRLIFQITDYAGLISYYSNLLEKSQIASIVLDEAFVQQMSSYRQSLSDADLQKVAQFHQSVKNIEGISKAVADDLDVLNKSWSQRCEVQHRDFVFAQVRPDKLYQPDFLPHLQVENLNFSLQWSFGESSGGQDPTQAPSSSAGAATDYDEAEAIIFSGSVAVGSAIGSIAGGIGAVPGAAIGAAVGGVIISIKRWFESSEMQDKIDDLIAKIRRHQESQIARLTAEAPAMIAANCASSAASEESSQEIKNLASNSLRFLENVRSLRLQQEERMQKERDLVFEKIQWLQSQNILFVKSQMNSALNDLHAEWARRESLMKESVRKIFADEKVQLQKTEVSPVAELETLNRTWEKILTLQAETQPVSTSQLSSYLDLLRKSLKDRACLPAWRSLCDK